MKENRNKQRNALPYIVIAFNTLCIVLGILWVLRLVPGWLGAFIIGASLPMFWREARRWNAYRRFGEFEEDALDTLCRAEERLKRLKALLDKFPAESE